MRILTEDKNSKSTVDSLRRPLIDEFPFVNPPLSEQQQIVSYLDEHTQLIDKTISVEERRIDTLIEYRQSLISEVVTGKLKVVD
jgi:type I restriction enzyme S subunit